MSKLLPASSLGGIHGLSRGILSLFRAMNGAFFVFSHGFRSKETLAQNIINSIYYLHGRLSFHLIEGTPPLFGVEVLHETSKSVLPFTFIVIGVPC